MRGAVVLEPCRTGPTVQHVELACLGYGDYLFYMCIRRPLTDRPWQYLCGPDIGAGLARRICHLRGRTYSQIGKEGAAVDFAWLIIFPVYLQSAPFCRIIDRMDFFCSLTVNFKPSTKASSGQSGILASQYHPPVFIGGTAYNGFEIFNKMRLVMIA